MTILKQSAIVIALASKGDPVIGMIVVALFYLAFNSALAIAEKLIFGHRLEHFGDVLIALLFMAYAGVVVCECAFFQINNGGGQ